MSSLQLAGVPAPEKTLAGTDPLHFLQSPHVADGDTRSVTDSPTQSSGHSIAPGHERHLQILPRARRLGKDGCPASRVAVAWPILADRLAQGCLPVAFRGLRARDVLPIANAGSNGQGAAGLRVSSDPAGGVPSVKKWATARDTSMGGKGLLCRRRRHVSL